MRRKFVKKIERPKGYIHTDDLYEMLDGIEKEKDCEYGDYGEVLSEWTTCDYGEVLEAISYCDVVQAIPLDKVKQARDEMWKKVYEYSGSNDVMIQTYYHGLKDNLAILDELIKESED